jgi:hypothetical protein
MIIGIALLLAAYAVPRLILATMQYAATPGVNQKSVALAIVVAILSGLGVVVGLLIVFERASTVPSNLSSLSFP